MKKLWQTISLAEWRFVFWCTAIVLVVTTMPYLIGYWMTPAGTIYNGLHALSPGDVPIYYSYINQASHGNFLAKDLFTSEPQSGGLFDIWWTGVGLAAGIFHLSPQAAFQVSRVMMIPVFTIIAYVFISYIFSELIQRKLAFIFLLFSSGVGAYVAAPLDLINFSSTKSYWWPIDLWLTESNTFNVLYQTSHFIASLSAMLLIFLSMLLAFEHRRIWYAVVTGLLALVYFNFHPYYIPAVFGTLGLYLVVQHIHRNRIVWWQWGYYCLALLISLPSVGYHVWVLLTNPVIAQRALQNVTTISPWPFVMVGYGFLWVGFVAGVTTTWQRRQWTPPLVLLACWFVTNMALIYSPLQFHSRYTQGLHVILVVFTVIGVCGVYQWLQQHLTPSRFDFWVRNPALWFVLFVLLFCTSTLYVVGRDVYQFVYRPGTITADYYLPIDVVRAMTWLSTQPQGVVLAFEPDDKFIPAFSNQVVFIGHGHETLFYDAKLPLVVWFYSSNTNDDARQRFLIRNHITYVFYSQYEKQLGSFNPAEKPYLQRVFHASSADVYRVSAP